MTKLMWQKTLLHPPTKLSKSSQAAINICSTNNKFVNDMPETGKGA